MAASCTISSTSMEQQEVAHVEFSQACSSNRPLRMSQCREGPSPEKFQGQTGVGRGPGCRGRARSTRFLGTLCFKIWQDKKKE
ncbi:unnamed protein product [Arctogadus glacialis]